MREVLDVWSHGLDYTAEEEHQYWNRLHLRNYSGDLSIILFLFKVFSHTISMSKVCLKCN